MARRASACVAVALALGTTACGGTVEGVSTPSSHLSPSPVTATQPPATNPDGNPVGAPYPFYVVGDVGVEGPAILYTGTVSFTVTNNGVREHKVEFVRLEHRMAPTAVAALVHRSGDRWPPASVEVLDQVRLEEGSTTGTIDVPALKVGSYALVDMATDPGTGKPYAYRGLFVVAIEVADMPA